MSITITKTKLAAALVAAVMLIPATALASHVFDDVPDGAFYAAPVEWAFDNGITTGTSPTTFSPLDDVTRGESVTFLKRYHDNVVEAAIANGNVDQVDGYDANDLVRADGERTEDAVDNWDGSPVELSETITAPTNGYLVISYNSTITSDNGESASGPTQIGAFLELDGDMIAQTYGGVSFNDDWRTNFNHLNVSTVVAVTAGEHTVTGISSNVGSFPAGGLLYIYDQSVSVLFVPFGGDGLGPV